MLEEVEMVVLAEFTQEEIIRELGDPVEVDRQLERFRRAAKVLSSKHPRMIDLYPNQWIAVHEGKVKARGRTFWSLMKQVEGQNLPKEHVLVRFIDKSQRSMIL